MTHSVGDTIGARYRLKAVIGEGGQATVYRADDLEKGGEVAVKVLNLRTSRDPAILERVTREQQAMMALAGTNAVKFVDAVRTQSGSLCLVMELLQGTDLQSELEAREAKGDLMSVDRVIEVMSPIVETLEKAHSVGIVHRDLKPGNIFVIDPAVGGGTRLLDFGFARLQSSQQVTKTGMVLGSPHYIAPESWRGLPGTSDGRADVYALGVILFRALGGRLPFAGKNLQESLRLTTTAERPSLHALRPELSNNVDIWVERALAIDPEERFRGVGACWAELLWALGRAPRPVPRTEPPEGQQRFEIGKIRAWLEAPVNAVPSKLQAAWRLAAGALKRLAGVSLVDEGSVPRLPPLPEPPAWNQSTKTRDRAPSSAEAGDAAKPRQGDKVLGPLPFPSPPPIEPPSGERPLRAEDGETSATVITAVLMAPDESTEFELSQVGDAASVESAPEMEDAELSEAADDARHVRDAADIVPGRESRVTSDVAVHEASEGRKAPELGSVALAAESVSARGQRSEEARGANFALPPEGEGKPAQMLPADQLRVLVSGPQRRVSAIDNTVPLDEMLPEVTGKRRSRSSERTLLARNDHTLIATPEERSKMQSGRPSPPNATDQEPEDANSAANQKPRAVKGVRAKSTEMASKTTRRKKMTAKKKVSKKTTAKKKVSKKTTAKKKVSKKTTAKKKVSKKTSKKKVAKKASKKTSKKKAASRASAGTPTAKRPSKKRSAKKTT